MARAVYTKYEYTVIKSKRGHVIINTKGIFEENHAHVKHLSTCKKLLNLMDRKIVPDSDYLRGTTLRISLNDKYKDRVRDRMLKNKKKTHYININKGVKRK